MIQSGKRKFGCLHWVGLALSVLAIVAIVGWQVLQRSVKSRVETEMAKLELGESEVGNVGVSQNGITARNLKFFRNPGDKTPWLSIDELKIKNSLRDLAGGAETFDSIELNAPRIEFDLDQTDQDLNIDLTGLLMPAETIQIKDGSLVLHQKNKPDLVIDDLDLLLKSETGTSINVTGTIGALVGGKWELNGNVAPAENQFSLTLDTEDLQIKNGQWQDLPFLPSGIQSVVEADGQVSVDATIKSDPKTGYTIAGAASIDRLDIAFPAFDLPFQIESGDFQFSGQTIAYDKLTATSDGTDQWILNGKTELNQWPIQSTFTTQFRDVSTDTWRKLVIAIPEFVDAELTGEGTGSVTIEKDLRTTIELTGDATSDQAKYGTIAANAVRTKVQIKELVFDQDQKFESVLGFTIVDAAAVEQPVERVFETFDLTELNQQLEMEGVGSAKVEFHLPLETADDLTTWELKIDGLLPTGSISGQAVRDVQVSAELSNGELAFRPVIATPANHESTVDLHPARQPLLNIGINWPIATSLKSPPGRVSIKGEQISLIWLSHFLQRQIQISEIESAPNNLSESPIRLESPDLQGTVDFDVSLAMSSEHPDQLELWNGDGKIENSTILAQEQSLKNIAAEINLVDGLFYFNNANGTFQHGGTLVGQGHIDIVSNVNHFVRLKSERLPVSWIWQLIQETDERLNEKLSVFDFPDSPSAKNVSGELTIEAEIQTQLGQNENPWSYKISANSEKIDFGPTAIRSLKINSAGDARQIIVNALHAEFFEQGLVDATGAWEFESNTGSGTLQWKQLPIELLAQLANYKSLDPTGTIDGNLKLKSRTGAAASDSATFPFGVEGTISTENVSAGTFRARPFGFEIVTEGGLLQVKNFRTSDENVNLQLRGQVDLRSPFEFEVDGKLADLPLSNFFQQASVVNKIGETTELTGAVSSEFKASGSLESQTWKSSGDLLVANPTVNGKTVSDISAKWDLNASDLEKSSVVVNAFDGIVKLAEFVSHPQRVRVDIGEIDALQVTSLFELPIELSGRISGDASLNGWSLLETRWADINLNSSALIIGPTDFGDLKAHAEYRGNGLTYEVDGVLLAGKLTGTGSTELNQAEISKTNFPFEVKLTNAALNRLYGESNFFRRLRPLDGGVSLAAKFDFSLDQTSTGSGRVSFNDLKWSNQLLSRELSVRFELSKKELIFDDVRADLRRGSIAAQVRWPLNQSVPGSYEIDVHRLDLNRMSEIALNDADAEGFQGLIDARLNGQLGRTVTGRGYIGVDQASVAGIAGQSFRLPIQYAVSSRDGSGKIELRRSTFRIFDGKASGTAKIEFGSSLAIDSDLKLSDVNTGKMLAATAGFDQADQGKLSGRLILKGNGIRSTKDLKGSFEGTLERAEVFQLPILEDLAKFLAGNNLQSRDYDSDLIDLRLDKGRIEVRSLNFFNSLAKVAITGDAFLDGRLNLNVAARVENLNQPTLIDQLAGSPLSRLSGSPAAFFAQAADSLSDRVVFLVIGGTFSRPQIRLDSGQQLREETIRYFLRGSQILPYDLRKKN